MTGVLQPTANGAARRRLPHQWHPRRIECKNATKDEAIALGVDQVRRYHAETPELFVPQMVFTATEAIGFSYGVTWNLIRRNIFNWKHEEKGNLEAKVKSFCDRRHVLALLKSYILFAEKDEELQKFILRQHQTTAVERVVDRCLAGQVILSMPGEACMWCMGFLDDEKMAFEDQRYGDAGDNPQVVWALSHLVIGRRR